MKPAYVDDPADSASALIVRTGRQAHVAALRGRRLDGVVSSSEDAIYAAIGVEPVPPERREAGVALLDAGRRP